MDRPSLPTWSSSYMVAFALVVACGGDDDECGSSDVAGDGEVDADAVCDGDGNEDGDGDGDGDGAGEGDCGTGASPARRIEHAEDPTGTRKERVGAGVCVSASWAQGALDGTSGHHGTVIACAADERLSCEPAGRTVAYATARVSILATHLQWRGETRALGRDLRSEPAGGGRRSAVGSVPRG